MFAGVDGELECVRRRDAIEKARTAKTIPGITVIYGTRNKSLLSYVVFKDV